MKAYSLIFASVFLAELGDKTQLATLVFATNPAVGRLGVFVAAAGALVASTAIVVLLGAFIGNWVAPGQLKVIAGLAFVAIGLWMLLGR